MSVDTEQPTRDASHRPRWARPRVLIPVALVVVAIFAGLAVAFQPWRLFLDQTVDEDLPVASPGQLDGQMHKGRTSSSSAPRNLASGSFISHEHETRGTVRVLELPDGQRILRLEDFRTSNGPDLKVWLSDSKVVDGADGWFVFDDGSYLDLGALKGNVGNQNYVLPKEADLRQFRSLAIWCDRFNVSFGAAELTR